MSIVDTEEMQEAIETLRSELPTEDTSNFTFDKRTKDAKDNTASGLTSDQLFNRFDELHEKGLYYPVLTDEVMKEVTCIRYIESV